MKRTKPAKRRDRRSSLSPYARKEKRPVAYSADYRSWFVAQRKANGTAALPHSDKRAGLS